MRVGPICNEEGRPGLLILFTALPGSVTLQRRGIDGTWETVGKRRALHRGRTRIELPREAASTPPDFRVVVFSPKNPNIASWIFENIDG